MLWSELCMRRVRVVRLLGGRVGRSGIRWWGVVRLLRRMRRSRIVRHFPGVVWWRILSTLGWHIVRPFWRVLCRRVTTAL